MRRHFFYSASAALLACVGDTTVTPPDGGKDATANDVTVNDGAIDATGDASAPFTPQAIDQAGQLALWLEASSSNLTISSGLIGEWVDLSKNKNNATNPNGGPSVDDAAVNGHNAVFFGAGGTTLKTAPSTTLDFAADQFLIMAVARTTGTDPTFFFSKVKTICQSGCQFSTGLEFFSSKGVAADGGTLHNTTLHWGEDTTDAGNVIQQTASWDGSVFDDANFHVVGARRTAVDTVALFVDGQIQTSTLNGLNVNVAAGAQVGAIHYGFIAPGNANGDIAELVVVHGGIIADQTVTDLYAYFKAKYAL